MNEQLQIADGFEGILRSVHEDVEGLLMEDSNSRLCHCEWLPLRDRSIFDRSDDHYPLKIDNYSCRRQRSGKFDEI
jgi:hypothetical protein